MVVKVFENPAIHHLDSLEPDELSSLSILRYKMAAYMCFDFGAWSTVSSCFAHSYYLFNL